MPIFLWGKQLEKKRECLAPSALSCPVGQILAIQSQKRRFAFRPFESCNFALKGDCREVFLKREMDEGVASLATWQEQSAPPTNEVQEFFC